MTPITVSFQGNTLFIVEYNGEAYTPMKPIIEGMGLAWQVQHRKLLERFKSSITEMVMVAEDGKQRAMTCLLLRKLAAWLYSISPNKVRPELRDRIIQYQAECDDVLWQHWTQAKRAEPLARSPLIPSDAVIYSEGVVRDVYKHAWAGYMAIVNMHLSNRAETEIDAMHKLWLGTYPDEITNGIMLDIQFAGYRALNDRQRLPR
ncbi:phage antirepressor N-terminal domain-containing protein [Chromobacterium haemolyticum]|uniref:phage antirepressor N-terminal domain-containing protein n=1 Tax=Chromobacterium TaxID=535 RepID=UPI004055AF55